MADKETKEKKQGSKGTDKQEDKAEKKKPQQEALPELLVRIYGYDIPGSKNIYTGLTNIKGVSWSISNAVCYRLGYSKSKKISDLSKEEIKKIEAFLPQIVIPDFLKNRRIDPETGITKHYYGPDLDMKREFDIKRLRNIKSYRGIRHALKLPVRGQRTRSHFRTKHASKAIKKKTGDRK